MSATTSAKRRTVETKKIESTLAGRFNRVEAYRYNTYSIRVRIVDVVFKGKSPSEREDLVYPLIEGLPEKTQEDITMLLLQTPKEVSNPMSLVSREFDDPSPSSL